MYFVTHIIIYLILKVISIKIAIAVVRSYLNTNNSMLLYLIYNYKVN